MYDGGNLLLPRHFHSVAGDVHIDEVFVDFCQGIDEFFLSVGQCILLAIVAFAVLEIALVESTEHDDVVCFLGFLYGFCQQDVSRPVLYDAAAYGYAVVALYGIAYIATGKVYFDVLAQTCGESVERDDLLLNLQRGGSASDGHHLQSILADDEHALGLGEVHGQHAFVVLQQHDTFLGNLLGSIVVGLGAEESMRTMGVHGRAVESTEYAAHFVIEFLGGVLAFLDEFFVGFGQIVVVIGVGGTHGQTVCPRTKFQVEAVGDGLFGVVASTPVADNNTIESPVTFQNAIEGDFVVAVVLVVVEVIGTHDAPCTSFSDGSLEGGQIDFMECAVTDDNVDLMTVFLIVVQRIMLHTGRHSLGLQALDIGNDHTGGQVGVFAHVFKVTAVERCAVDVDTRTENHGLVAVESLFAKRLTIDARKGRIP